MMNPANGSRCFEGANFRLSGGLGVHYLQVASHFPGERIAENGGKY